MSNHDTRFEQKPNTKFQRRKRSAFHRTTPPHHCMYGLSVIVVYYLMETRLQFMNQLAPQHTKLQLCHFCRVYCVQTSSIWLCYQLSHFLFLLFPIITILYFFQLLFCWASICLTMLIIKIKKIANNLVIGLSLKEN